MSNSTLKERLTNTVVELQGLLDTLGERSFEDNMENVKAELVRLGNVGSLETHMRAIPDLLCLEYGLDRRKVAVHVSIHGAKTKKRSNKIALDLSKQLNATPRFTQAEESEWHEIMFPNAYRVSMTVFHKDEEE